jgi:hypothetical protein
MAAPAPGIFDFGPTLRYQIERGPFSEAAVIEPAGAEAFNVLGIFDDSPQITEGQRRTDSVPRFVVYEKPEYIPMQTKLKTVHGEYTIQRHTVDASIGVVLWLS